MHLQETNNLKSVWEETNALDAFIRNAKESGRSFEAERESAVIVGDNGFVKTDQLENASGPMLAKGVQIPRRPQWTKSMTAEELNEKERDSFLVWRRNLAKLTERAEMEENLVVTPFEKNLEVWRQLWRVMERSDVVIQIVDVRNPDLYRSKDLESYVKTISKQHKRYLLLLNKSDFMTKKLRERWTKVLCKEGVDFVFFSAMASQNVIDQEKRRSERGEEEEEDEVEEEKENDETIKETQRFDESLKNTSQYYLNTSNVLSREQLVDMFHLMHDEMKKNHDRDQSVFGMVGFPNVGKSSLINVLMNVAANEHTTRVAVGATPGKTKHFQTLILSDKVTLCDCPGLVFPCFLRGKADMIVNGILPVDQMREYMAPIALVCRRIPLKTLEITYKLPNLLTPRPDAPRYTSAKCLLRVYSIQRGYLRANGSGPDMARSSRIILKDYAAGRLLFCFPPEDGEEQTEGEEDADIRTADGIDAILSTREAVVAEEDSSFDVELLNAMRFEEDERNDSNTLSRDRVTKAEYMGNSSSAVNRRRAAKRGKGKGKGRRGRHGRDQTPYEDDVSLLNDFTFVQDDESGKGGKKKNRRRRRGEKSTKNRSRKNGVTFQKPF